MSLAELEDKFIEDDDEFIDEVEEEEAVEEEEVEEETEEEKELRELNEFIKQHEQQFLRSSSSSNSNHSQYKGGKKRRSTVIVEIPALLRLFKACHDAKSEQVRGDLLGYESTENNSDVIHITAMIPQGRYSRDLVKTLTPEETAALTTTPEEAYTAAAVARYRALHVPCDVMGAFECASSNVTKVDFVDRQAARQLRENGRCVVLLFDPAAAAQLGTLSLRALRLTDTFMELYREAVASVDALYDEAEARGASEEELDAIPGPMSSAVFVKGTHGLNVRDLYEEIPVCIRGAIPQRQFAKRAAAACAVAEEPIEAYAYMERNLGSLGDVFGSLASSANFYNKSLGNANTDTNQLSFFNSIAQGFQVGSCCDKVDAAANVAESKLYMVSGLQKDDE